MLTQASTACLSKHTVRDHDRDCDRTVTMTRGSHCPYLLCELQAYQRAIMGRGRGYLMEEFHNASQWSSDLSENGKAEFLPIVCYHLLRLWARGGDGLFKASRMIVQLW